MIIAYTGYPGEGKSLACTYRAWQAIKQGKLVFTNYPVRGAYKITFDDLVNYTFPAGSTVIIDEAGRYFNARKWASLPPEVFDLFTLHRHMGLDLIIAVQNFQRIDVALREVIGLVYWAMGGNSLWLPFIVYKGYYDVDRLGMKGEENVRHYIWKWTRARKLYDTHIMSKAINKDEIPLVSWDEDDNDVVQERMDQQEEVFEEDETEIVLVDRRMVVYTKFLQLRSWIRRLFNKKNKND